MSWWLTVGIGNARVTGLGRYDADEAADAMLSNANVDAASVADEHIRALALEASPLDRLLAEHGPLDSLKGDAG